MARRRRAGGSGIVLDTVATFVAVAEAGGVGAAARRLGLTQPAVSRALRRLEADLGTPVVERGGRPLRLTPAGEELLARGRRLLADADRIRAAVRDVAEATVPRVRLGLIDSFAATAGPGLVKGLRGHARQLTMWSGISPFLTADLIDRKLDFVVTTDPLTQRGGLERHRLLEEPFVLLLPRRMAEASDHRLEDLARGHPFVRYSARSMIGAQIEDHLRQLGLEIPQSLEFDSTETVFAMVAAGIGWAITTPLCLVHGRTLAAGLAATPLPGPSFARALHLVGREGEFGTFGQRIARVSRRVLDGLIAGELGRLAPWACTRMRIG